MSNRLVSACFLTLTLMVQAYAKPGAADPSWVRLQEGPFSVYTQSQPSEAAGLIHSFALLYSALSQTTAFHPDAAVSLKIIAFHSDKEFNQYRLNAASCAFYQQTDRGEYIVLQSMDGANRDVSFHEFSHFVFAHSHVHLPLWLNEGLADFYSTFQVSGTTVTFGAPVSGRVPLLRSNEWLPLSGLFDVSTTSSYYSNREQMALFYSESWALAHMLVTSPGYARRFPAFLNAVSSGQTPTDSFRLIYSKTAAQVEQDLHAYVSLKHLPTIEASFKPTSAPLAASSLASVSNAEMDINLSDLSLSNAASRAALQTRLITAASQLPQSAEAEEALGYVALRQGKNVEARTHFQLAVDRHSSDANVLFYLAHLNHEAGGPAAEVMQLLERALAIKPDLGDARLELALLATSEGDFAKALEALRKLTSPRPETAYAAAYTEAYCLANTEKLAEARAAAHRAETLAANDRDRAEISDLIDFIKQQAQDLVSSN